MFYDLNVPWIENKTDLQRTLSFLVELDYNVVAISYTVTGKLPSEITCVIPDPLPFTAPLKLRILRRCTLLLTDASQNYRLSQLAGAYDLLAIRPTGANAEKALQLAVNSNEADILSLDCSQRYLFHFRPAHFSVALQRGLKIELCYAAGLSLGDGGIARRNLISNASSIIRATRGRGIIISSEARRALECRAPFDVINLAAVWGMGPERGHEAVAREARAAVVQAEMKRRSYRGAVDVIDGGDDSPKVVSQKKDQEDAPLGQANGTASKQQLRTAAGPVVKQQEPRQKQNGVPTNVKRAASNSLSVHESADNDPAEPHISNRERKRRAKRARVDASGGRADEPQRTDRVDEASDNAMTGVGTSTTP